MDRQGVSRQLEQQLSGGGPGCGYVPPEGDTEASEGKDSQGDADSSTSFGSWDDLGQQSPGRGHTQAQTKGFGTLKSKKSVKRKTSGSDLSAVIASAASPLSRVANTVKRNLSEKLEKKISSETSDDLSHARDSSDTTKRTNQEDHSFTPITPSPGERCAVCDKRFNMSIKDSIRCNVCDLTAHHACWTRVLLGEDPSFSASAKSDLLKCLRYSKIGPDSYRVTRSSFVLLKQRFEAAVEEMAKKEDDVTLKVFRLFIEYLDRESKASKDRTANEVISNFIRILNTVLKRTDHDEKSPQWRAAYDQFRFLLEDYDYFTQHKVTALADLDARDIAEEFASEDQRLFNSIQSHELHNCAFTKRDKYTLAPNVMACINRFNQITMFVITEVLQPDNPKDRAYNITLFIIVASFCRDFGDFNALKAILAGLQAASVYRLKKTWALVSGPARQRYDDLALQMSEENNWGRYRDIISGPSPPRIPFLGVALTDLTYIDVAFSTHPDVCEQKTDEVVGQVLGLQSEPYPFSPIFSLQTYLQHLQFQPDEDQHYSRSLFLEPKKKNPQAPSASSNLSTPKIEPQSSPAEKSIPPPSAFSADKPINLPPDRMMEILASYEERVQRIEEGMISAGAKPMDDATENEWRTLRLAVTQLRRALKRAQVEPKSTKQYTPPTDGAPTQLEVNRNSTSDTTLTLEMTRGKSLGIEEESGYARHHLDSIPPLPTQKTSSEGFMTTDTKSEGAVPSPDAQPERNRSSISRCISVPRTQIFGSSGGSMVKRMVQDGPFSVQPAIPSSPGQSVESGSGAWGSSGVSRRTQTTGSSRAVGNARPHSASNPPVVQMAGGLEPSGIEESNSEGSSLLGAPTRSRHVRTHSETPPVKRKEIEDLHKSKPVMASPVGFSNNRATVDETDGEGFLATAAVRDAGTVKKTGENTVKSSSEKGVGATESKKPSQNTGLLPSNPPPAWPSSPTLETERNLGSGSGVHVQLEGREQHKLLELLKEMQKRHLELATTDRETPRAARLLCQQSDDFVRALALFGVK